MRRLTLVALLAAPVAAIKMPMSYGRHGLILNMNMSRPKMDTKFFESLREQTSHGTTKTVENPWQVDNGGAEINEGTLGDIPVVTVTSYSGVPLTQPGALRLEEANASTVALHGRARRYFVAEEMMRNQWDKTKNGLLLKYLKRTGAHEPDKIVILVDGGDVVFGGCTDKQIRSYYNATVKASGGAKVVAAAEVSPYPVQMQMYYNRTFRQDLEDRMRNVTQALDVKDGWVEGYADCRDDLGGPCDNPPAYRFFNYGFMMGPAKALEKVVFNVYKEGGFDQATASKYFLLHPDEVTLDYTGHLALSLHNLAEDDGAPVVVKKSLLGKKHIHNKVTGQTQCFVQGNGNGEGFVHRLAKQLA